MNHLTWPQACAIRQAHTAGASIRQLADQYNVGLETVRRVVRWETWRKPPVGQAYGPVDEAASLARLQAKLGEGELIPAREARVAASLEEAASELRRGDNLLKDLGES